MEYIRPSIREGFLREGFVCSPSKRDPVCLENFTPLSTSS